MLRPEFETSPTSYHSHTHDYVAWAGTGRICYYCFQREPLSTLPAQRKTTRQLVDEMLARMTRRGRG